MRGVCRAGRRDRGQAAAIAKLQRGSSATLHSLRHTAAYRMAEFRDAVDGDVRADGARRLLELALDDRGSVADRQLGQPARPCGIAARPPAARTFCTQLHRSPSIGAR
jgi:hypothetical protein